MNISHERKNLMSIPSVVKLFLKKLPVSFRFSLPTFQDKIVKVVNTLFIRY